MRRHQFPLTEDDCYRAELGVSNAIAELDTAARALECRRGVPWRDVYALMRMATRLRRFRDNRIQQYRQARPSAEKGD